MSKKKNLKKAESQAKKSAVETLRFQAHWGLKQLGHDDDMFHQLVDAEVDFIAELELELAQDMLAIKSLVDGVKQSLKATPTPEKGDFMKSPTALKHLNQHTVAKLSNKSIYEVFMEDLGFMIIAVAILLFLIKKAGDKREKITHSCPKCGTLCHASRRSTGLQYRGGGYVHDFKCPKCGYEFME